MQAPTISLKQPTKTEALAYANSVAKKVHNGSQSAIETLIVAKATIEAAEQIITVITPDIQEELKRHPKGVASVLSAKVQTSETPPKWDYTLCGDPIYESYEDVFNAAKKQLEERATFLKSLPKEGIDVLVEGVVYRAYPPVKTSKTIFKTTLGK